MKINKGRKNENKNENEHENENENEKDINLEWMNELINGMKRMNRMNRMNGMEWNGMKSNEIRPDPETSGCVHTQKWTDAYGIWTHDLPLTERVLYQLG